MWRACQVCRFLVRDPMLGKESEPRKHQIKFGPFVIFSY